MTPSPFEASDLGSAPVPHCLGPYCVLKCSGGAHLSPPEVLEHTARSWARPGLRTHHLLCLAGSFPSPSLTSSDSAQVSLWGPFPDHQLRKAIPAVTLSRHLACACASSRVCYMLVSWGCCNKSPQAGGLKHQKYILPQSGGARSQKSGCCRAGLPPEAPGEAASCRFQLLGAPGVAGLAALLPCTVDGPALLDLLRASCITMIKHRNNYQHRQ